MFSDYQDDVVRAYRQKQSSGHLPDNLKRVTTANLKAESAEACAKRYSRQDERTLARYFEISADQQGYLDHIKDADTDDFKSVYKFLRGETKKPGEEIVEILAWLIDFQPRPYLRWVSQQPEKKKRKEENEEINPERTQLTKKIKITISFALSIAFGMIIYFIWPQPSPKPPASQIVQHGKCMYWAGDLYLGCPCNVTHRDTPIVPLDTVKLAKFRKIENSTLSRNAVGKVWYAKLNGTIEVFSDSGFHPVDTNRRLLHLTRYMLDKYLLHK